MGKCFYFDYILGIIYIMQLINLSDNRKL